MSCKFILFFVLSILSFNSLAMEAILGNQEVEQNSLLENRLNEAFEELKVLNVDNLEILDELSNLGRVSSKILKYISEYSDLEFFINVQLNQYYEKIVSVNDASQKAIIFSQFLVNALVFCIDYISYNNLEPLTSFDKKLFLCLLEKVIGLLCFKNIDLCDHLIVYTSKGMLLSFTKDCLEELEGNFEENFLHYVLFGRIFSVIEALENNFNDILNLNLLNKKLDREDSVLALIVRLLLTLDNESLQEVKKNLIHKLLHEPTVDVDHLKILKKQLSQILEKIKEDLILADNFFTSSLVNQIRIIDFRLKRIEILKTALFQAMDSEDFNFIKKRAYELYSITRDFQNKNGDTPLHLAVMNNNKKLTALFLGLYPELLDMKNNAGQTSVNLAAGSEDRLKLILNIAAICSGK